MANKKITELTAIVTAALEDLAAVVDDPSGTPATKKATIQQILDTISGLSTSFTIADGDLFAVNDVTDGATKAITLSALRTALEAGLLPDEGENWKIVRCDSATATDNGTTLKNEYTTATGQTPFGSALSADNPYFLILMPGIYDFGATGLTMDTDGVGLIGIVQPPNNLLPNGSFKNGQLGTEPAGAHLTCSTTTIDQTTGAIRLQNLSVETTVSNSTLENALKLSASNAESVYVGCTFLSVNGSNTAPMNAGVAVNGYWEDCRCIEDRSFGSGVGSDAAGVFVRCVAAGSFCFGGQGGDASGVFIGCHCGNGFANFTTFGTDAASGIFIDCVAQSPITTAGGSTGSFGNRCTASGTFINCRDLNTSGGSFGGSDSSVVGTASGLFIGCYAAGDGSFGGNTSGTNNGNATGQFYNCVSQDNSFGQGTGTITGTFIGCVGGDECFGHSGTFNGTAVGCRAGTGSFGGGDSSGACAGNVLGCYAGTDSFGGGGGDLTGTVVACQGGNGSFAGNSGTGAAGTLSGICHSCYGFNGCFAGSVSGNGGTISGRCYQCAGDASCFAGAGTSDTGGTISGKLFDCHAGEFSFAGSDAGTGGTISGEMFNCTNEEGAFADGSTPGSISGRLERCTILGELAATLTGVLSFMDITATTTNADGVQVGSGATIHHSTIRGNGTGDSVGSAGAVTCSIFLSAFNSAFDANVTNDITTPNNVVDANV